MIENTALKSVSTMLVEEVHRLSYAANTYRVRLRSVTDEEIGEQYRLPPGAIAMDITVNGDRAKWYDEHLGEYVTLEIRRRD